jgi:drug/metabolite transporter (DMT)-like permease
MAAAYSVIYTLLFLAVAASSVWHVLGKLALTHGMDASVFLVYRLIFASVVLFVGGTRVLGVSFVFPRKEQLPRILFVGICTFIHSICFVYGLQLTTPFLCAVMQPSVPVLVWLISVWIGQERGSARKAVGVILCSLGAVGAASASSHHAADKNDPMEGTDFHTGTLLIICQCVFYACHLVFQQPLLQELPPVQVTCMMYGISGVIAAIVALVRTVLLKILPSLPLVAPLWSLSHDPTAWVALAFCVVFATAFTHGIYAWASKRVAPTTVAVFITVEPITTTLVSLVITRTGLPSLVEAGFAGIVAVGVIIVLKGGGPSIPDAVEGAYEMVTKIDLDSGQEDEFNIEERGEAESSKMRRPSANMHE